MCKYLKGKSPELLKMNANHSKSVNHFVFHFKGFKNYEGPCTSYWNYMAKYKHCINKNNII